MPMYEVSRVDDNNRNNVRVIGNGRRDGDVGMCRRSGSGWAMVRPTDDLFIRDGVVTVVSIGELMRRVCV